MCLLIRRGKASLVLPTEIRKLYAPSIVVSPLISVSYLGFLGITLPLSVSFWRPASPSLAWCCWLSAVSVDGEGELNAVALGFRKYPTLDQSRTRVLSPMSRRTPQCVSEPAPTSAGTGLCTHAVRPAQLKARSASHSITANTTCRRRTVPLFHHRRYSGRPVDRHIASPFHMRM